MLIVIFGEALVFAKKPGLFFCGDYVVFDLQEINRLREPGNQDFESKIPLRFQPQPVVLTLCKGQFRLKFLFHANSAHRAKTSKLGRLF